MKPCLGPVFSTRSCHADDRAQAPEYEAVRCHADDRAQAPVREYEAVLEPGVQHYLICAEHRAQARLHTLSPVLEAYLIRSNSHTRASI